MKLITVRHGETEWTLSGRCTGTTDVHLTARGRCEAARALGLDAGEGRLVASSTASISVIEDHHDERRIGLWNLTPTLLTQPDSGRCPRDERPARPAQERLS